MGAAAEAYTRYLGEQKTFAFAPKLFSNARMYHPKSGCALSKTCDDDGTAVFWDKDKYTCSEVVAFPIDVKLILAMDANIQIPTSEEDADMTPKCRAEVPEGQEVFDVLTKGAEPGKMDDLKLYSNPSIQQPLERTEGGSNPSNEQKVKVAAVSVNKMRGADSAQPQKVGEYELHNIDWVACTGAAPVVDADQLQYFSKENEDSFQSILPNENTPSDHLPVLVSFPAQ